MDPNNQGYGQAQGYYNEQQQYNNAPPPKQYQQYEQGPPPQQYQQQQYQQYDNGGPGPQEQMPNPPSYGQNYSSPDGKAGFEQTFKVERPKWNDLWAGALLIVVFLGYVAISGYCLHSYASNSSLNNGGFSNTDNTFGLNGNTLVLFAFVLVAALVLGYAYVVMARMFTKQFIWISGILNICMTIATAAYQFYRHAYVGGVLFALLAVFTIICFISWIKRIPFSVLMFQTAVDVSKKFGHVYLVSFMGGLIAALFAAWFAATLVAVYIRFQPSNNNPACAAGGSGGDCSKATVIGLVVYITFAGYWITEWLKNTIHVTISGVYGAWYFNPNNPAKGATRGAAKRALTYSFGSIAFGSLIVAILDFLRFACSIARGNGGTGNPVADCAFCILQCILGLIQWAIEFVNRYAFSYIALYGKAYVASAKGTWKMIKDRGIDALINECLVGPVLSMGCLFVAVCCALVAYIYLDVTDPAYNEGGAFTGVIVVYAFLIGLQIAGCFVVPINSGIDTIFVGMGWDPQCLMQQHGDLYQRMVQVYPHVQQAIHA
ncbi:protein pns1 [Zymoseptoria brevis]|uniref:Protein PNS1 n=1 Tax=Zymoseptoria brevis TaxID=1047168 RepID=A0A0F4GEC8_9PEZI|nr:protein pns1 [Zymoseptoria brevis]